MGGLSLAQLGLGSCRRLLDRAALATEQVEVIGNTAADAVEIEHRIAARAAERGRIEAEAGEVHFFMLGPGVGIGLRQPAAGNRRELLPCPFESGVAGGQAVVVGERPVHQAVQLRRAELSPPRKLGPLAEIGHGSAFAGRQRRGVIGARWRLRPFEVRTNGAAGQQRDRNEREGDTAVHRIIPCAGRGLRHPVRAVPGA